MRPCAWLMPSPRLTQVVPGAHPVHQAAIFLPRLPSWKCCIFWHGHIGHNRPDFHCPVFLQDLCQNPELSHYSWWGRWSVPGPHQPHPPVPEVWHMNLPFLTFLSLVRPARALQAEWVQLITSLPESRMPKAQPACGGHNRDGLLPKCWSHVQSHDSFYPDGRPYP